MPGEKVPRLWEGLERMTCEGGTSGGYPRRNATERFTSGKLKVSSPGAKGDGGLKEQCRKGRGWRQSNVGGGLRAPTLGKGESG